MTFALGLFVFCGVLAAVCPHGAGWLGSLILGCSPLLLFALGFCCFWAVMGSAVVCVVLSSLVLGWFGLCCLLVAVALMALALGLFGFCGVWAAACPDYLPGFGAKHIDFRDESAPPTIRDDLQKLYVSLGAASEIEEMRVDSEIRWGDGPLMVGQTWEDHRVSCCTIKSCMLSRAIGACLHSLLRVGCRSVPVPGHSSLPCI